MARIRQRRRPERTGPDAAPVGPAGRPEQRLLHRHVLGVRQQQRPADPRIRQPGPRVGRGPDPAAHRVRPRRDRGRPGLHDLAGETATGRSGLGPGQVPTAERPAGRQVGAGHREASSTCRSPRRRAPAARSGYRWRRRPRASAPPLTDGATFVRRAGNYDIYQVGAGTFEFASGPVTFASLAAVVTYFSSDPRRHGGPGGEAPRGIGRRGTRTPATTSSTRSSTRSTPRPARPSRPDEAQVLITLSAALR